VKGGIDETNHLLTCSRLYTQRYICLDAGTINAGIKAIEKNTFTVPAATVLQEYIKATFYFMHI
jgi:hypothetical protein